MLKKSKVQEAEVILTLHFSFGKSDFDPGQLVAGSLSIMTERRLCN